MILSGPFALRSNPLNAAVIKWPNRYPIPMARSRGPSLTKRIEMLLIAWELPRSFMAAFPHELSGGQRPTVRLARALAMTLS